MDVKLIVVGGDAKTTEIDLKLPTVIGRGRGATLTLPHPLVSRQHCEIYENQGRLFVRDLGSLNGTFIGNEPISEAELPPGELLTVGAVTFRAIYGELLDRQHRDAHAPPAARRPAASAAGTVRSEAVDTISPPQARTVKDPSTVPGMAPRKAPSEPQEHEIEEALAVDDDEIVQFHAAFVVEEEAIVLGIEEDGFEPDAPSGPLFTGAEEESADVMDDVLPEGSTFDSAKPLAGDDTSDALIRGKAKVELDAGEPEDEAPHRSPTELHRDAPLPNRGAQAPQNSRQEEDEALQSFLRNLK